MPNHHDDMSALADMSAVGSRPGPIDAELRQTVDAVSAALNDPELQGSAREPDRRERVGNVMRESFDFRAMARESLGSQWARLAAEQQDEFVGLFGRLFDSPLRPTLRQRM